MKNPLLILLLVLAFCGCAEKSVDSLIQPGTGAHLKLGGRSCTLHVDKRDGNVIRGIRLAIQESDGKKTTIVASTGTVADASDHVSVIIFLGAGQRQTGDTKKNFSRLGPLILQR